MTTLHVIVPDGIDDPMRPSGGNAYDRKACRGLSSMGWSVHERAVAGAWPRPDSGARAALARVVEAIPDGDLVLIDGLIASTAPQLLVPQARRLRLAVLVHMPLGALPGDDGAAARPPELAVLSAARSVITTSAWTRRWLLGQYGLDPDRVAVAEPGVDAADLVAATAGGGRLLCVAAVVQGKGHDVLLAALAAISDLDWCCTCVGSLDRDRDLVARLEGQALASGIGERVRFVGPLVGTGLDAAYASADVLVLASRAETYGMVVTEALARGLPCVATAVGGLPAALGRGSDGSRPGLLVRPDDPSAFAAALRCWLASSELRQRLRTRAIDRRGALADWATTATRISAVLGQVAA